MLFMHSWRVEDPYVIHRVGDLMPVQAPDLNLLVQRILTQQGTAIVAAANEAFKSLGTPLAGSPALRDREWAELSEHKDTVLGAFVEAAGTVASLLVAADEYRQGIIALMDEDKILALPAMNCVRAIHDASLRICSLTDPGISPQARLARSAATFLAMVQGGIPILHSLDGLLSDKGDLQRGRDGRDGAVEHFRSIGLQVKVNEKTGQAQNVRCDGEVANVEVKGTELSLKYTPRIHYAWGLNSGATHSNPWLTNGLRGPYSQMLVSMVFPVLDMSDILAANLLGYAGLPAEGVHQSTHTRRIMLMDRTGLDARPFVDYATYHRGY
jgi:hypothetical protein